MTCNLLLDSDPAGEVPAEPPAEAARYLTEHFTTRVSRWKGNDREPPGGQREQLVILVVQVDPVLTPVLAVRDELEVPAEQWMKPVRHPHTSAQIIQTGCS